jgi:microcystin-dependent protein
MSDPFVAEIRMFAGNFAPNGWAFCNGQLMPISQNTALFSLLGTNYGGDGYSTFALPDLSGAFPMHAGQGQGPTHHDLGEHGGASAVALQTSELPAHSHAVQAAATRGNRTSPAGALWAQPGVGRVSDKVYTSGAPDVPMHPAAIGVAGGGEPHNNLHPYLAVNFIIALVGIFPARP